MAAILNFSNNVGVNCKFGACISVINSSGLNLQHYFSLFYVTLHRPLIDCKKRRMTGQIDRLHTYIDR